MVLKLINQRQTEHKFESQTEILRVLDIDLVIRKLSGNGALAQLGERNAGSVEVVGSIPTSSTITETVSVKNGSWISSVIREQRSSRSFRDNDLVKIKIPSYGPDAIGYCGLTCNQTFKGSNPFCVHQGDRKAPSIMSRNTK